MGMRSWTGGWGGGSNRRGAAGEFVLQDERRDGLPVDQCACLSGASAGMRWKAMGRCTSPR